MNSCNTRCWSCRFSMIMSSCEVNIWKYNCWAWIKQMNTSIIIWYCAAQMRGVMGSFISASCATRVRQLAHCQSSGPCCSCTSDTSVRRFLWDPELPYRSMSCRACMCILTLCMYSCPWGALEECIDWCDLSWSRYVPRSDSQRFYNSRNSDALANIVVYAGPHGVYVLRRITGGMPWDRASEAPYGVYVLRWNAMGSSKRDAIRS